MLTSIMHLQLSFEEVKMNYVPYRVCIARAVYSPEFTPTRSEKIVSATSLNVKDHVSAGVGIEFKVHTHNFSSLLVVIMFVRWKRSSDIKGLNRFFRPIPFQF